MKKGQNTPSLEEGKKKEKGGGGRVRNFIPLRKKQS